MVSGVELPRPLVNRQRGITLIEAAIVVIVVGLLLGGVMAGQQLVRSAHVIRIINQLDAYQVAILAFTDRYGRLPGDYHQASVHIRCIAVCLNGNGNQRVEASAIPVAGSEVHEELLVWSHLAGAGLISGGYVASKGAAEATPQNSPVNLAMRYWSFVFDANFGTVPAGTPRHNLKTGNQIHVDYLAMIDAKIDDGFPNSGVFRFSGFSQDDLEPAGDAAEAPDCTSGPGTGAAWNVFNDTTNCAAARLF